MKVSKLGFRSKRAAIFGSPEFLTEPRCQLLRRFCSCSPLCLSVSRSDSVSFGVNDPNEPRWCDPGCANWVPHPETLARSAILRPSLATINADSIHEIANKPYFVMLRVIFLNRPVYTNGQLSTSKKKARIPEPAQSEEFFFLDNERLHSRGGTCLPAGYLEVCRN